MRRLRCILAAKSRDHCMNYGSSSAACSGGNTPHSCTCHVAICLAAAWPCCCLPCSHTRHCPHCSHMHHVTMCLAAAWATLVPPSQPYTLHCCVLTALYTTLLPPSSIGT